VTIDDRIRKGDFAGALDMIAKSDPNDPGLLLLAFNLEVRMQQFAEAQRTIRRVIDIAPQLKDSMDALARTARAEERATLRLVDPELAGKRAGIGMPPPHALGYVKAAVLHASKDYAGAAEALAELQPPRTPGTLAWRNGQTGRFEDLHDSDELTGPILPCYSGETLLDLAYSQLASITFHDARTSFDVMWIPAEVVPITGQPMHVRVPAFHPGTGVAAMDSVRTGQMTVWDRDNGYALAIGQRDLKQFKDGGGYSMTGILQIRRIEFDTRPRGQA
jgi:protein involved in temperature-dependent protein secretion